MTSLSDKENQNNASQLLDWGSMEGDNAFNLEKDLRDNHQCEVRKGKVSIEHGWK